MKMSTRDWSVLTLVALSLLLFGVAFLLIPEDLRVPIHWNITGEVDGWAKRESFLRFAAFQSVLSMLLGIFYYFTCRLLGNQESNVSTTRTILAAVLLFFVGIQSLIFLGTQRENGIESFRLINIGMGFLFMVIGNVMPKLKINRWTGIRVKWTMDDPQVWYQVHRTAGKLWFAGGGLIIFESVLLPKYWTVPIMLGVLFLLCGVSLTQAWLLACRKRTAR